MARSITTIEGLSIDRSHPQQRAWIAEQWRMPYEEGPVLPSPSGHWQSCHACHVCRAYVGGEGGAE
jgi:hypothetical protein